jgi:predicted lipoprotein with Yx(FWY)xxD motif
MNYSVRTDVVQDVDPRRWTSRKLTARGLRAGGAGLLCASGAIHLDLYLTGYRAIPTIGWMFLLQVVTAFVLAAALAATGSWFVAAVGAGFAATTLVGYLVSVWVGIFGFREVRTAAGLVAGAIDVVAAGVLTLYAVIDLSGEAHRSAQEPPSHVGGIHIDRRRGLAAAAATSLVCVTLLALSAVVAIGAPSATPGGTVELRSVQLGRVSVLTTAPGYTLYWFALDSPTRSRCTGSCAAYWPPVTGSPTGGSRVAGVLGTIERGGGITQATFDGHPLYRYVGDTAPGQTNGNGLDLNGGTWHEVTIAR